MIKSILLFCYNYLLVIQKRNIVRIVKMLSKMFILLVATLLKKYIFFIKYINKSLKSWKMVLSKNKNLKIKVEIYNNFHEYLKLEFRKISKM